MTRTKRFAAVALAAVLATPSLTACNLTSPSTCEAFSLAATAGGKGGSGGKSGKSSTTKTKPKSGTTTKTKSGGGSDDCDDD
jgi:hypothetical protein